MKSPLPALACSYVIQTIPDQPNEWHIVTSPSWNSGIMMSDSSEDLYNKFVSVELLDKFKNVINCQHHPNLTPILRILLSANEIDEMLLGDEDEEKENETFDTNTNKQIYLQLELKETIYTLKPDQSLPYDSKFKGAIFEVVSSTVTNLPYAVSADRKACRFISGYPRFIKLKSTNISITPQQDGYIATVRKYQKGEFVIALFDSYNSPATIHSIRNISYSIRLGDTVVKCQKFKKIRDSEIKVPIIFDFDDMESLTKLHIGLSYILNNMEMNLDDVLVACKILPSDVVTAIQIAFKDPQTDEIRIQDKVTMGCESEWPIFYLSFEVENESQSTVVSWDNIKFFVQRKYSLGTRDQVDSYSEEFWSEKIIDVEENLVKFIPKQSNHLSGTYTLCAEYYETRKYLSHLTEGNFKVNTT
jgi:hypothetical protein